MSRIYVTFTEEGWHKWPAAPQHRAYLRNGHRHLFGFRVSLTVHHDDRDVEFHDLIGKCRARLHMITGGTQDYGERSCEAIARELCHYLVNEHGGRQITVEVNEDGECGAIFNEEEL